jgi:V-type H+-transporting ATPase subunit D
LKTKPVAGVTLPIFGIRNIDEEKYGDAQILGITGGGQTLNVTKKHFYEFLKKIVEIATLQTSYLTIDEALKITNRRVNALEYIVVPRIEYVIKYIITELDERSKEEKFKIKKILANKRKHKEREDLMRAQTTIENAKEEDTIFGEDKKDDEEEIDQADKLFK